MFNSVKKDKLQMLPDMVPRKLFSERSILQMCPRIALFGDNLG